MSSLPSKPSNDDPFSAKRKQKILHAFNKTAQSKVKYGKAGTRTEHQKKLVKEQYAELWRSFTPNEIICFTDGACRYFMNYLL